MTALTPLDANYNPADAQIDEMYNAVLGYAIPTRFGTWESTASLAYSDITDIRGFLRPTLIDDGSQNADSKISGAIFSIYMPILTLLRTSRIASI